MDKDRREAERSGDPIRYALELRRIGEDLRAKRLLQYLAWDQEDAMKVLDQLYPLCFEWEDILIQIEGEEATWRSWANEIAGSVDPRVNQRLEESVPQELSEALADSGIEQFQDCFLVIDCKEQGPRLKTIDFWVDRLEWAEPLPAEMSDFMDWLRGIGQVKDRSRLYEFGRIRLGWALYRWGFGNLLRRWAESEEQRNWRERTLVERFEKTLSVKLAPEGQAIPSWVKCRRLPSFREARVAALPRAPYFPGYFATTMTGKPADFLKESFKRGHLLFVMLPQDTDPMNNQIISNKKLRFVNAVVSSWQELIGDRIITTERWLEYVILWEFGQLKTVLKQLIELFNETRDSHEEKGEMSIGVAAVSGDIKASFALAKSRCEKAIAAGLNYLPECLTH